MPRCHSTPARCREACRLRWLWYETATKLYGNPGDAQKMLDDRGKPEYQEALRLYREHVHNCTECKKLGVQ